MEKTVYKTKVGMGIIAFIVLVNVLVMTLIGELIPIIFLGLFMSLIILSITSMKYVIEGQQLFIKQFNFNITKPIDILCIQSIEKRKSFISAPAGSTERIELRCGKLGTLTISPKNEEVFIQQLMSINPQIKFVDKDKKASS